MLDKNDLRDSILFECDVLLHLYRKLPEGALAYRPAPDQRSTEELLRYLSFCSIAACHTLVDGNWDWYGAAAEKAKSLAGADFPAAMTSQREQLAAFFADLSARDFAERPATMPTGETVKLGRGLLDMALKWLVAYRMQLFLYAKAAGNHEIGTVDCWAGRDPEPA